MAVEQLVGREPEIGKVGQFLDGLRNGSRTLVLEGEVGIGKTTVLQEAARLAQKSGCVVLTAHPVEAEMPLEFAALADLLDDVPVGLFESLPVPQRRAVEVAVQRGGHPSEPTNPRTIATAVLAILRSLAATHRIVVVVDDFPWLDAESARVLTFALRRTGPATVGLITAIRTDWSVEAAVTLVDQLDADRVDRLHLGPLGVRGMRALLNIRDPQELSRSQLLRIHQISGGNPLFAKELARHAAMPPSLDAIAPIPQSLRQLVLARISDLSAGERDVLLTCALAFDSRPSVLSRAAADATAAADDVERLVRAGILIWTGEQLEFVHPLIRSVVAGEADPDTRRVTHRRLAAVMSRPETQARHLALGVAGTDESVAAAIEAAAQIAASRGACETAAELAELSSRLTPEDRRSDQVRRIAFQAECRFEASDPAGAARLLESILDQVESGPYRAELLRRLGRYLGYRSESFSLWTATLLAALDECLDDPAVRATVMHDLAFVASNTGKNEAALTYLTSASQFAAGVGDPDLETRISSGMAWVHFLLGHGVRRDLIERGTRQTRVPARLPMELRPNLALGHLLHLSDDLDAARRLYELEYVRATDEGVETSLPMLLWGLVETETFAGNLDRAEQLSEEGYRIAEDSQSATAIAFMSAVRSVVHAYRGRLEAAHLDAHLALDLAREKGLARLVPFAVQAFGIAYLSLGDATSAHRALAPYANSIKLTGIHEPGMVRFLPDEIEALVRLNKLEQARQLLDPFEARSTQLDRKSCIAVAARCRGMLLAAHGDTAGAEAALEAALDVENRLGRPLEHARTLLAAAEIHRRARHKRLAVDRLRQASDIFISAGASMWAERVQSELDRLSPHRSTPTQTLTATERQVAELVARGLATPQVAIKLFMAQRTVESHLTHIYQKLQVTSRTEMSRAYLATISRLED